MTSQLLLTEREAAERLRLSARTLRKARRAGQLHYVLIGTAVRYTIGDLESFVDSFRRIDQPCPAATSKPRSTARQRKGAQIIDFTARNSGR